MRSDHTSSAGGERAAIALAAGLREAGIFAVGIRPPTVPAGTSRLRLAVTAVHSDTDLDRLISALEAAWPGLARAA